MGLFRGYVGFRVIYWFYSGCLGFGVIYIYIYIYIGVGL